MKPSLHGSFGRASWLALLTVVAALPACAAGAPPAAPPLLPPPATVAPPPPPAALAAPLPAAAPAAEAHDGEADVAVAAEAHDGEVPDDDDAFYDSLPSANATATSYPLLALSDAEVHARFRKDPASLGPLSVGRPNAGALVNGVMMPKSPKWIVLEPGLAWGTQETIDGLTRAIERVHAEFPGSQPIPIGHISSKQGGYLPVHKSHQAGRDVDVGYYFTTPKQHFVTGTRQNLDLARSLAFVKALLAVADVEMILVDTSIQKLLVEHALAAGEDPAWLDRTFQVRQKPGYAPVRHVRGHKNHLHVRFASPRAVAMGRRVAGLVAVQAAPPPGKKGAPAAVAAAPGDKLVPHRARSGDTLAILARRYGTTVEAIKRANNIKGTALKAGHVYTIPVPPPPVRGAPLPGASPAAHSKSAKKGKSGG